MIEKRLNGKLLMTSKVRGAQLSLSRAQEIAELAEAIAEEYFPSARVDPVAIVRAKGITVSYGHYGDAFDGLLEHRYRRFHIYINLDRVERAGSPRARFTFGHELGHYFIDEHRNALAAGLAPSHPSICEYESDLLVEKEADHFASNLLMPTYSFKQLAAPTALGLEGILKIAEHFGTSVTSTAIKYAQLDIVPCAVIKWNKDGFGWKWLSTETFRARYHKTIESVNYLPEDSPTAKAVAGEHVPAQGFFSAGTTVSAWFPYVDDGGYRNAILIEQAVPLGRFGALTFLYPESGSYRSSF
jgi:Zn-dependent peptidase ImmA (M78 family)